jgi:hypothetical protein
MAFVHGSSTAVLVNEKVVSTEISGWTMTHARAVSEVTCVGQVAGAAGASFIPGLMSGTMALRGPQGADQTLGLIKEITDAVGVDNAFLATTLPDGVAIGKPAFFVAGDLTDYAIDAAVADAVGMTLAATADESTEMGYVIHALAAETADGNGTAVDRGAVLGVGPVAFTTHGLVAAIHVTAYSGLTSAAIKIQHSTDNSVWADLVAFTSITALTSERVRVANGTTINRYLRVVTDVTGTGSVTFLVAAAPR